MRCSAALITERGLSAQIGVQLRSAPPVAALLCSAYLERVNQRVAPQGADSRRVALQRCLSA